MPLGRLILYTAILQSYMMATLDTTGPDAMRFTIASL